MFVNLDTLNLDNIKFFIVGSGPAAYSLAKKLEEKKISTLRNLFVLQSNEQCFSFSNLTVCSLIFCCQPLISSYC